MIISIYFINENRYLTFEQLVILSTVNDFYLSDMIDQFIKDTNAFKLILECSNGNNFFIYKTIDERKLRT